MADIRQQLIDSMVDGYLEMLDSAIPAEVAQKCRKIMRGIYYRHVQKLSSSSVELLCNLHFKRGDAGEVFDAVMNNEELSSVMMSVSEEAHVRLQHLLDG